MLALDGNAIAGTLADVFGADMTAAPCECAGCSASFLAAETEVYTGGPGIVVRCRSCGSLLMVLVTRRDVVCVDMRGVMFL